MTKFKERRTRRSNISSSSRKWLEALFFFLVVAYPKCDRLDERGWFFDM